MPVALEIAGVRFGRLVALRRVGTYSNGEALWLCVCDCGTETSTTAGNLRTGHTRSCSCLKSEHGARMGKASRRDVVGYEGAHWRTVSARGRAAERTCPCGAPAAHWAYSHGDPDERSGIGRGVYSMDPQYYVAMCVPCHSQMDATFGREEEPDD